MAAFFGSVAFGATGALIPLVAATPKTVVRVTAPANQRVRILGYGFFLDGTLNSAQPIEVRIGFASAAGTSTSSTPIADDQDQTETFQTTAGVNATVEPTYTNYVKAFTVHPQLWYEYLAPEGQEIKLKGGGIVGFVANAPAAVNVRGYVMFEE